MNEAGEPRLTALEIASGVVAGRAVTRPALTYPPPGHDPHEAAVEGFEAAVRSALSRPPCLVSFSGGLDSSTVLSAAAAVARRERLPLPVAITWRFADVPSTHESDWQESVMAELGLHDWVRLEGGEQLDFVGPLARRMLATHGVRYPANAHLHLPLLERASGGSLLTGVGGDEFLGRWRWHDPAPRTMLRELRSRAPAIARRGRGLRASAELEWLRPLAARRARWRMTDDLGDPADWHARIGWQASRRRVALTLQTLEDLARGSDTLVGSPFAAPAFLGAAARAGGRRGLGRRPEAMRALLGEHVPEALRHRTTKARFGGAFWTSATQAAAAAWDGGAVDERLVDATALRRVWRAPEPELLTALLLQSMLLADPQSGTPRAHAGEKTGATGHG